MVWERGGMPFRQIFWSRNGAAANIVDHRWNANTEAFRQIMSYSSGWPRSVYFLAQITPKRGIWHQKILRGPTDPLSGRGRPPPAPPSTATRRVRGRKLPRWWNNEVSLNRQHAPSYGMLSALIYSARRWMFSSDVVCCLVRLVCQAGHAYSKTGRMTVRKKYSKSCLSTLAHFNFFTKQSFSSFWRDGVDVVVPI